MVGSSSMKLTYTTLPEGISDTTSLHTSICSTSLMVHTHPAIYCLIYYVKPFCRQNWRIKSNLCAEVQVTGTIVLLFNVLYLKLVKLDFFSSFSFFCRQQVEPVAWPRSIHAPAHPAVFGVMGLSLWSVLLLFLAHCYICLFQQSLHFTGA